MGQLSLHLLNKIAISRCITKKDAKTNCHTFGNACQYAYAAIINTFLGIEVHLVEAKAKVTPTKKKTNPQNTKSSRSSKSGLFCRCFVSAKIAGGAKVAMNSPSEWPVFVCGVNEDEVNLEEKPGDIINLTNTITNHC
ncbi:hypothetical protein PR048_018743 [Dryococelus australis]|uniref:Uncharacterized protein n=1 Tax=Dryococelus australis TaxID=614101 RepID=A0ABQ9HD24_9NEOP|nr:hypothetical protein PR048_018743 [Dryococelus australis]